MLKIFLTIGLIFFTVIQNLSAQRFEDYINSYIDLNAESYLRPLSDMITGNLHTGIREWSSVDSNFHVKLGLVVMASVPSAEMKTFTATTSLGFTPEQTAVVPTVIGPNEAVVVEGDNGTIFIFPVGYNMSYLPLAAPQITIGGILNTEISARFFGFDLKDEVGKISIFGLGGRHQLSQYFKSFPLDLSIGYYFQKFNVQPYIFSQQHLMTAHLGKSSKLWSGMLTLGLQSSKTQFKYEYGVAPNQNKYEVNVKGKYPFFAEISGAVKLWFIQIRGSVGYAGPWNAALGINVRI